MFRDPCTGGSPVSSRVFPTEFKVPSQPPRGPHHLSYFSFGSMTTFDDPDPVQSHSDTPLTHEKTLMRIRVPVSTSQNLPRSVPTVGPRPKPVPLTLESGKWFIHYNNLFNKLQKHENSRHFHTPGPSSSPMGRVDPWFTLFTLIYSSFTLHLHSFTLHLHSFTLRSKGTTLKHNLT